MENLHSLSPHLSGWTLSHLILAGLNLSGGQEVWGEEPDPAPLCEAGPGVHRPAPGGRDHLPGDLQGLPSDGTIHAA